MTIGRETTYITEPFDENGRLDYIAALNQKFGEGIKPENNAAVEYLRALGPGGTEESYETYRLYCEAVGIEPDGTDGPRLLSLLDIHDEQTELLDKQMRSALKFPWRTSDYPDLAAWVDANDAQLDILHQALDKPNCYFSFVPAAADKSSMVFSKSGYLEFSLVTDLLALRAQRRLGERKFEQAIQDLLTMHHLGLLIQKNASDSIDFLKGAALQSDAFECDATLVGASGVPTAIIKKYRKQLMDRMSFEDHAIRPIDLHGRFTALQAICDLARRAEKAKNVGLQQRLENPVAALKSRQYQIVDWNEVLREHNRVYDEYVELMKRCFVTGDKEHLSEIQQRLFDLSTEPENVSLFISQLGLGLETSGLKKQATTLTTNYLLKSVGPVGGQLLGSQKRTMMRNEIALLGLALAEYRGNEGVFPKTLDELKPEYITAIPADRFADEPLQYESNFATFQLYSVGENELDDGGRTYGQRVQMPDGRQRRADDIIIRYPQR